MASVRVDLLVLGAFEPELAEIRATLGAGERDSPESRTTTVSVGAWKVAMQPAGIGLVAAASGASAHIERLRPRAVVLVGTCGAYPEAPASQLLSIGEVVVARDVKLVDLGMLAGTSALPDALQTELVVDHAMRRAFESTGLRVASVATTLAITVNDRQATTIAAATASSVEHLEAYAVAHACAERRIRFAAVLGVANFVGSAAREQWRANHAHAADNVARAIVSWLNRGAPGLEAVAS